MNSKQISRIMGLIKRTGDRFVILDSASDDAYTVMGLDDYERLLNSEVSFKEMNEEEMLEKVNRDIAVWKTEHPEKDLDSDDFFYGEGDAVEEEDDEEEEIVREKEEKIELPPMDEIKMEDNKFDFDEDEDEEIEPTLEAIPRLGESGSDGFSDDLSKEDEEKLDDLPEEEQDRFLLEPV